MQAYDEANIPKTLESVMKAASEGRYAITVEDLERFNVPARWLTETDFAELEERKAESEIESESSTT